LVVAALTENPVRIKLANKNINFFMIVGINCYTMM
jgi:hypothetical protein